MEQDLKEKIDLVNQNLRLIYEKKESLWRSFLLGVARGIGSIVGVAIALAIIGWILNSIGVIPAFSDQARDWQQTLEEIKRLR